METVNSDIKEFPIKALTSKGLTALALYFGACAFMDESVEYELYAFHKGEDAATFKGFHVDLYWPEGLYLNLKMRKDDRIYEILQKYLPLISRYSINDEPENLDDDEEFYYTFRLSEKVDEETTKQLMEICPKVRHLSI